MKATSIYQRLTRFGVAFLLAVSTLTAVLPFVAAPSASALSNADYTPVTTDGWVKDRTTPSGGFDEEVFDGRNTLRLGVAVPSNAPSSFYQYEGVGKAVSTGSTTIRGDLYIDPNWPSEVRVGFWGVGYDSLGAISSYPVIERNTRADSPTGWRIWDSAGTGGWRTVSVTSAISGWNKIEMALDQNDSSKTNIFVNDVLVGESIGDPTNDIRSIILNNYNFVSSEISNSTPYNYNVYWSNLEAGTQYVATIGIIHYSTIQAALAAAQAGDVIELNSDITTTSQLTIDKSITLNGNGHTITGDFDKTSNSNNSVVAVWEDNVIIKNLTVQSHVAGVAYTTGLHGINAYNVVGLQINDVTVRDGLTGIVVNGSKATVERITSSGNQWHAINVDNDGELTISDTNTWNEELFIYIDNIDDGTVNDSNDQYKQVIIPNYNNVAITAVVYTSKDGVVVAKLPVINGQTNLLPSDATFESPDASVVIPVGTVITDETGTWDGTFIAPIVSDMDSVTIPTESGYKTTISLVIEVGAGDTHHLKLSQAARIVLPGQAGKMAGYIQNGVFAPISTVCSTDTQIAGNALPVGGDCYMTVGSDLVIWTKHFTKFVAYSVDKLTTPPPTNTNPEPKDGNLDGQTSSANTLAVITDVDDSETTASNNEASVITDETDAINGESDVEAASDTNVNSGAYNWAWWLIIGAVAAGIIWWLIATYRRRQTEE